MVTLQTADNALKTFYLDAVAEEINTKISPFYSMIEKTSAYVTGKGIAKTVRTGMKRGVGAGSETGALPTAKGNEYITLTSTLKNLYGTIEISDKAIRASANSEGAFVNLLNDEMQALVNSAKSNFSRMLFGDGTGYVTPVNNINSDGIEVQDISAIKPGMTLELLSGRERTGKIYTVLSIDKTNRRLEVDDPQIDPSIEEYVNYYLAFPDTAIGQELTGLKKIFGEDTLYGVSRNQLLMRPYSANVGKISDSAVLKAIDEVESGSGGKINLIICSRGVRRAFLAYCHEHQVALSTTKIGDETVVTFNGIPIVVDDYCQAGTMYLLNTNDFKLCQLCDWEWMEGESGKILKQIPGTPVYTATLVKYAELLCEKPNGQGRLINIVED